MIRCIAIALAGLFCIGTAAAEPREARYGGFTGVEASGQFRTEVRSGEEFSVRLEGADVAQVRVAVRSGELRIERADGDINTPLDLVAHVSAPRIDSLKAYRGAQMDAGIVHARDLRLDVSTGGELAVGGTCETLRARATLGGVLRAEGLACAQAQVRASFGGVADVRADDSVQASAFMGGEIDVDGAPARREQRSSWGGEVAIR